MSNRIYLPLRASKLGWGFHSTRLPGKGMSKRIQLEEPVKYQIGQEGTMKYQIVTMRSRRRIALALAGVAIATLVIPRGALADGGQHFGTTHVFIRSAQVNADFTQVTLPLFRGTSHGQTVYFVITDSSDRADAAVRQVNYAPKLANAKGTPAVQIVTVANGIVDFPATVDFSPRRLLTPGPTGFPPASAQPGAVGEQGYSPLIQMPDGTVLNAPQRSEERR